MDSENFTYGILSFKESIDKTSNIHVVNYRIFIKGSDYNINPPCWLPADLSEFKFLCIICKKEKKIKYLPISQIEKIEFYPLEYFKKEEADLEKVLTHENFWEIKF